jgi:hypothetical protein
VRYLGRYFGEESALTTFPASPSPNQFYPDPPIAGQPLWQFDGQRWRNVRRIYAGATGPQGPGGPTGPDGLAYSGPPPPPPWNNWMLTAPIIDGNNKIFEGVIDGSNANMGDVGEYVQNTAVTAGNLTSFDGRLISQQLSAGDWDVSGLYGAISTAGVDNPEIATSIEVNWIGVTEPWNQSGPGSGPMYVGIRNFWTNLRWSQAMPRARVLSNALITFGIDVRLTTAGAPHTLFALISARRIMR